jgi:hypothetical protein
MKGEAWMERSVIQEIITWIPFHSIQATDIGCKQGSKE